MITGIRQPHRRHADETVDNHYRQLYQIRRAHGDVISRVGLLFAVIGIYSVILVSVVLPKLTQAANVLSWQLQTFLPEGHMKRLYCL